MPQMYQYFMLIKFVDVLQGCLVRLSSEEPFNAYMLFSVLFCFLFSLLCLKGQI